MTSYCITGKGRAKSWQEMGRKAIQLAVAGLRDGFNTWGDATSKREAALARHDGIIKWRAELIMAPSVATELHHAGGHARFG